MARKNSSTRNGESQKAEKKTTYNSKILRLSPRQVNGVCQVASKDRSKNSTRTQIPKKKQNSSSQKKSSKGGSRNFDLGIVSPSSRQLKRLLASTPSSNRNSQADLSQDTPPQAENLGKNEALKCSECAKIFLSFHGHDMHLEKHDGRAVRCWQCNIRFSSNRSLVQHYRFRHKLQDESSKVAGFHNLVFVDFSSDKFPEVSQSYCEKRTIRSSSQIHDYHCSTCQKSFPIDGALRLHNEQSHYTPSRFICNHCHHDYSSRAKLEQHKQKYAPLSRKHLSDSKRSYIRALSLMPVCMTESLAKKKHPTTVDCNYYEKLRDIDYSTMNDNEMEENETDSRSS